MPRVSICIPTYNQTKYLMGTLESVFSQDYDDFEVIITDDSPNDLVRELLRDKNWLTKVRYFRNIPALGSPANWNFCINLACGDYIKILHHDDSFASPSSLRKFVGMLDHGPDIDFAFSGSAVIDSLTGVKSSNCCQTDQCDLIKKNPEILFYGNIIGAPSATIFRRKQFLSHFDIELRWLVDIDFYIFCLANSRNIAMTSDCLIVTPINVDHQVTEACKSNAKVELFEYLYLFDKYYELLIDNLNARYFIRNLFERYRICKHSDLNNFGVGHLIDPIFFDSLRVRHFLILKARDRIAMHFPALYRLFCSIRSTCFLVAVGLIHLGSSLFNENAFLRYSS